MISAALDLAILGTELAATTFVGAILAETLLLPQTKAAIGLWAMKAVYENFWGN
jgi:hypothetical protein